VTSLSKRASRRALAALALAGAAGCAPTLPSPTADAGALARLPWDSVVARARGTTVRWRMWRGDPSINAFVDAWVAPRLRNRYGITLQAIEGQGAELVNSLTAEREARGTRPGTTSLVWINGETFAALRSERLLAGPWAGALPNATFIDSLSPIIARDFEADPAGFESPWGTVTFALVFDSLRTPTPPQTVAELKSWILAHPGRFTHDQGFTGVTFLKMVMYATGGGVHRFAGGFRDADYVAGRDSLFGWLETVRPTFWRGGVTYPPDVAAMHRLFANGEIDVTMTNNHREVAAKIRAGVLPASARAVLLRDGTIANTHFVGIPFNAPNPAGAMVVADFLLTPEAQWAKAGLDRWGDGTVLDVRRLPPPWPARFATQVQTPDEVSPDSVRRYERPEVDPGYHNRLLDDWRARFRRMRP
jgi:putative spermidine/putrescine transport system substrate-binding protein